MVPIPGNLLTTAMALVPHRNVYAAIRFPHRADGTATIAQAFGAIVELSRRLRDHSGLA